MKKKILKRDNFVCQKCGFEDKTSEDLEVRHIKSLFEGGKDSEENLTTLCAICYKYAPDSERDFKKYLEEKIDGKILNSFRHSFYSIGKRTKKCMTKKFELGHHLTKAPKGYKLIGKQLIPHEQETKEIQKIFQEFLNSEISLTHLAKKNNMTTAGMKKLLKNTTYLGKVKFAHKESDGQHKPLIETSLFEKVQQKIKQKCWV